MNASTIDLGNYRVAISHDGNGLFGPETPAREGNPHDPDDIAAVAFSIAMCVEAGVGDKLIHVNHSNHLPYNNPKRHVRMINAAEGAVDQWDFPRERVFDCQSQLSEAIVHFQAEAEDLSRGPIFYALGGPMEVAWRQINGVTPSKRDNIICISHSPTNDNHVHAGGLDHGWEDIKALGARTLYIKNQN